MKFLFASDSFKGTLSSERITQLLELFSCPPAPFAPVGFSKLNQTGSDCCFRYNSI